MQHEGDGDRCSTENQVESEVCEGIGGVRCLCCECCLICRKLVLFWGGVS